MVAWGWIILASIFSALAGAMVMAMFAAASDRGDNDSDVCAMCVSLNWGVCKCDIIRDRRRKREIEAAAK